MRRRPDGIYRETFTAQERQALTRAAEEVPLEAEAELLRVLIMRELGKERPDDERVGRMIDRLVRVVRAQRIGAQAGGRDHRVDQMAGWLAEIARKKQQEAQAAAAEHRQLAELPEATR